MMGRAKRSEGLHQCGRRDSDGGFGANARSMDLFVTALACALPLTLAGCGNNGPPDFALSLVSGQTATATITQGGTTPDQLPGGCGEWLGGQHHAGVERAAAGGGCCAGLGDGGDRIATDVRAERGFRRSRDSCTGHLDGNRGLGESAGFELDHPHADADTVGDGSGHALKDFVTL